MIAAMRGTVATIARQIEETARAMKSPIPADMAYLLCSVGAGSLLASVWVWCSSSPSQRVRNTVGAACCGLALGGGSSQIAGVRHDVFFVGAISFALAIFAPKTVTRLQEKLPQVMADAIAARASGAVTGLAQPQNQPEGQGDKS